jgi:hypothetical protein
MGRVGKVQFTANQGQEWTGNSRHSTKEVFPSKLKGIGKKGLPKGT